MTVRILYFGPLAAAKGRREESREVAAGETLQRLWQAIREGEPALSAAPTPAFARNAQLARPDDVLSEGDVVAFLPPVGGG